MEHLDMRSVLEARLKEAEELQNPALIRAYNETGPSACVDVLRRIANYSTRSYTPLKFEHIGHRGRIRAVILKQPMNNGRYIGWLAIEHSGQYGPKLSFYVPSPAAEEDDIENIDTVLSVIREHAYGKRQQSRVHIPGKTWLVEEIFNDPTLLDPDYLSEEREEWTPSDEEMDFDSSHTEREYVNDWDRHDE